MWSSKHRQPCQRMLLWQGCNAPLILQLWLLHVQLHSLQCADHTVFNCSGRAEIQCAGDGVCLQTNGHDHQCQQLVGSAGSGAALCDECLLRRAALCRSAPCYVGALLQVPGWFCWLAHVGNKCLWQYNCHPHSCVPAYMHMLLLHMQMLQQGQTQVCLGDEALADEEHVAPRQKAMFESRVSLVKLVSG